MPVVQSIQIEEALEHAGPIERGRPGRYRYWRVRQDRLEEMVRYLGVGENRRREASHLPSSDPG